jgi:hypothetical protein
MKKLATLICVLGLFGTTFGQDIKKVSTAKEQTSNAALDTSTTKHWYLSGTGSLAISQAAFSNWAAGGQNSMGLTGFINLKANYKKGRHAWGNTLDLGYGFQMLGKTSNLTVNKTDDKIELTSAYGYQLTDKSKWYFSFLVNFRTQFSAGYNYPDDSTVISNFMAPGYLIAGVGFTYAPAKWFALYLSPTSGRFTFVLDQKLADQGAFGVEKGKNIRGEFGPYVRADLNKDLAKQINLATSLELFTDYLHQFGNIDVNWSLLLTLKVNKWLAASIATQLIYDDDVVIKTDPTETGGPRTQFKELLGIGVSYKFH